ncbi:MAG: KamA family radical SAM protein [Candidatus Marinimicrobia bacterium]|jgi:lysine 2,3-aminomutase|nr:KamA family radical SAM protein [Candidatus Neomarinimicrobiota bacterium]MBT4714084.1 KamA family radical SAM protein [Candidatus Neomarinimicrobiota bacterium]MBT4944778.1 KamA family radical SAM protein [Candidatus Neomarinimicrobiota bacterium]MBT5270431.1 KamA family radical SAM protein [Candidatus Neomarinimicrobiota bacterium]MBT6011800.1 KamA family radical SAM protein [Candidatus Neomarinimicrobiota bacterium]
MISHAKNPRWSDWTWQHAHSCKDLTTLTEWLERVGSNLRMPKEQFNEITSNYRMGITPYYFGLINRFDDSDPIYRQIVPASEELNILPEELLDPIGDEAPARGSRPLKALIHRYSNRVLLIPTAQCAVYCRFCFRKRLVGDTAHNAREEDLSAAYDYIKSHPEIEEVILTGGDPLTLGDQALLTILKELSRIQHLRVIRIHTRLPVVNPFRLTPALGEIITSLKKPVWVSAHFNHSAEITETTRQHILNWVSMGIPFLNQSVLLRGVNDSPKVLKELFLSLIEMKVKPYYLHQADLVQGTSHLRVSQQRGLELLKELQGEVPGYALPHYVQDNSDGSGKIPLQNQWL